jgi:glycerol-3-phosphate acyltransferase PlsX
MAMAKTKFKTLPGIGRPAMVSAFPTATGSTTILDLGANIDCDDRNLVEFAIMGGLYVRALGITDDPRIALLNIGVEDLKGNETIRMTAARLKEMRLPGTFVGFVEGDDIPAGKVDLVVTDGFTGNVALKTAEGTSRLIADFIRQSARGSFWSRLGFALAMPTFRELKRRMDPRKYNGAMLLGVRGICIKSHGGADAEAFATAIRLARTLAQSDINQRIEHEIADLLSTPQASVG